MGYNNDWQILLEQFPKIFFFSRIWIHTTVHRAYLPVNCVKPISTHFETFQMQFHNPIIITYICTYYVYLTHVSNENYTLIKRVTKYSRIKRKCVACRYYNYYVISKFIIIMYSPKMLCKRSRLTGVFTKDQNLIVAI